MTPREKAGMRLIAVQDAITAAEESIRILKSSEQTALRDIREAEQQVASPAIEVEMRQHMVIAFKTARWECNLAGSWFWDGSIYTTTQDVRDNGNAWLAALGKQLGVKLVPKWEDEKLVNNEA